MMNFIIKRKRIQMSQEGPTKLMKEKMIPNWAVLVIAITFYIVGFLFRGIYKIGS